MSSWQQEGPLTADSVQVSECEAELRLHDFSDGSMAFLTCDMEPVEHGDAHHDPVYGVYWETCRCPGHLVVPS